MDFVRRRENSSVRDDSKFLHKINFWSSTLEDIAIQDIIKNRIQLNATGKIVQKYFAQGSTQDQLLTELDSKQEEASISKKQWIQSRDVADAVQPGTSSKVTSFHGKVIENKMGEAQA